MQPVDLAADQRWGNRRVEIERVRLLDEQGVPQPVFETGRSFRLELDYWAPEPVTEVVFGMALQRHDGIHISGPNTHFAGLALPPLHGHGTVIYTVAACRCSMAAMTSRFRRTIGPIRKCLITMTAPILFA